MNTRGVKGRDDAQISVLAVYVCRRVNTGDVTTSSLESPVYKVGSWLASGNLIGKQFHTLIQASHK